MLVQLPVAGRPGALPVLVALYRRPEWARAHGTRHKTPAQLTRLLLARLVRGVPARQCIIGGDTGYGTSETARWWGKPRRHLTLGCTVYRDAAVYEPPPPRPRPTRGRPRVTGQHLASPQAVVAQTPQRLRLTVTWDGGGTRALAVVTGTGHWSRSGEDLVAVRWVSVPAGTGTQRDEDVLTTDITMPPPQRVEYETQRWALETTCHACREDLPLESTKGSCQATVLRRTPG